MPPTQSHSASIEPSDAVKTGIDPSSTAPDRQDPSGHGVLLMIVVLALHSVLMVGEIMPGPRWLAAVEGVIVLLAGLSHLRRIAEKVDHS